VLELSLFRGLCDSCAYQCRMQHPECHSGGMGWGAAWVCFNQGSDDSWTQISECLTLATTFICFTPLPELLSRPCNIYSFL
jgi:hypothetical protein